MAVFPGPAAPGEEAIIFILNRGTVLLPVDSGRPTPQTLNGSGMILPLMRCRFGKIINSRQFVALFGALQGEQLKTAPRGVDTANEAIDLLRYKQFLLIRKFTDAQVLQADFYC